MSAGFTPGSVRYRLDLALHRELQEGESIVWQGMKLARVEPASFVIYLFAIPWTAFALFWMSMAAMATSASDGGILGWAFPLFGLPFVAIGLGMMAVPFLAFFQRGRVLFAVTDRRVLKLSLGRELEVVSVPASRIGDIVRRESGDASGMVELSLSTTIIEYGGRRTSKMQVGRVDDVKGAYEAILVLSERP